MENCRLYGCPDGCHLKKLLEHQNKNGGKRDKSGKISLSGPYWNSKGWELFIKSMLVYSDLGCVCSEELKLLIKQTAEEKLERHEFIENPS